LNEEIGCDGSASAISNESAGMIGEQAESTAFILFIA
jgi:hypothetical protein